MLKTAKEILSEIAFRDIYKALRERLESYAACLVRDREAARDLVSNAIAAILQHPGQWEKTQLQPYLFRAVHNLCLNHRRDAARHQAAQARLRERSAFQHYSSVLENCSPSEVFSREISQIWAVQLSDMPEEVRKTYLLRSEGHSYKEIAALLGITENRVDKNLRKAIGALKKSLSDYI